MSFRSLFRFLSGRSLLQFLVLFLFLVLLQSMLPRTVYAQSNFRPSSMPSAQLPPSFWETLKTLQRQMELQADKADSLARSLATQTNKANYWKLESGNLQVKLGQAVQTQKLLQANLNKTSESLAASLLSSQNLVKQQTDYKSQVNEQIKNLITERDMAEVKTRALTVFAWVGGGIGVAGIIYGVMSFLKSK